MEFLKIQASFSTMKRATKFGPSCFQREELKEK